MNGWPKNVRAIGDKCGRTRSFVVSEEILLNLVASWMVHSLLVLKAPSAPNHPMPYTFLDESFRSRRLSGDIELENNSRPVRPSDLILGVRLCAERTTGPGHYGPVCVQWSFGITCDELLGRHRRNEDVTSVFRYIPTAIANIWDAG